MTPTDSEGKERTLYFDTDCLELLENSWHLSKKKLAISAVNFFLSDDQRIITPLRKANKRGTSGAKWKQAYQALKHDRINSLKQATIKNLIDALGALYILNLYYKDACTVSTDAIEKDSSRIIQIDSAVFSVYLYRADIMDVGGSMSDESINGFSPEVLGEAIYVLKYRDKDFVEIHESICNDFKTGFERLSDPAAYERLLKYMFGGEVRQCDVNTTIYDFAQKWGGGQIVYLASDNTWMKTAQRAKKEVALNKSEHVYPTLLWDFPCYHKIMAFQWGGCNHPIEDLFSQ